MILPLVVALRAQARAIDAVADALEQQAAQHDVLDVGQAAELAKCSPRSVRAAIKAGKLGARGSGRHVVIDRAELERWLRDLPPRRVRERHDEDGTAATDTEALVDELLSVDEPTHNADDFVATPSPEWQSFGGA